MKSLTEILNLPGNSEIPRDIEDVTLHVIEKIAKSNNSTELKSGGPWVRFFFHSFKTEQPINFFTCPL